MSSNLPLEGWYDYRIVVLSILIAISASYAALDLAGRVTAARGQARWWWLAGGTTAMGIGIWSMHYTGMLAFSLPVPVGYDWPTVVLSFLVGLLSSAVALYLMSHRRMGPLSIFLSSIMMGSGIVCLHCLSMAAMRMAAVIRFDLRLVALSVVLAVFFSWVAMGLALHFRDHGEADTGWRKLAGAAVMGAAIFGMHYTGMAAARFTASHVQPDLSNAVSVTLLGTTGIGVVTLIVQGLAVLTSFVDRQFHGQREISARILQSQDEERRRISLHLHETVSQSLAALKMNLGKLSRSNAAREPTVSAALAESIALVDESMREVRTLSYLLHPPLMEETGLLSSLRGYLSGFQERSGIDVTFEAPPELERLPGELETAVFRIVQECLTNVHRHSGSSTAAIRLRYDVNTLVLEVEDAGRGIPPAMSASREKGDVVLGIGITGIQERVHRLGGEMKIDSTGRGARVTVTLPLNPDKPGSRAP
jgi:signal transduction histidine kinase